MDQIVDKLAALGVPGLILIVVMNTTGWARAAALTTALASLGGPLGMLGGIGMLGIFGLIAKGLSNYGFKKLLKALVDRLREKGISKTEIERKVESYPISEELKLKVKCYL